MGPPVAHRWLGASSSMVGSYNYTSYIWPSVCTLLLLMGLAVYSGRRASVPGARAFAAGCLLAAAWAAGSAMEIAAVDVGTKIFWAKFQAAVRLPAVTAITCFILEYTWPGRRLTRRYLALLSLAPLLVLILILTNPLHNLMWTGFEYDGSLTLLKGVATWIGIVYSYALGLVDITIFAWLFAHSPQHRWPVVLMLAGQVGARALYGLDVANAVQSDLPLDVLAIALVFLAYAFALFTFRILDPIPLARRVAVEQLHAGMLVLDTQGRVVSLNPSAARILGIPAGRARNRPLRELLPAYSQEQPPLPDGAESEFSVRGDQEAGGQPVRHYTLSDSPLKDWRGLEVGRLLLLRDVTGERRARAQMVEQQRTLAMLQERDRLARELHDSTGQVLGYVSLQAQAIGQWLRQGNTAEAEAQLARLVDVAQDAHVDLRDSILSLRSGATAGWSFFAALEQHLAAYQENYGLCAELILPPDLAEEDLAPEVGAQLVRVIQEALTNARKHARARNVRVTLAREGPQATIVVADDGIGFDPGALPGDRHGHLGLIFMRERLAQIGGSLAIRSRLGAGTEVTLRVPLSGREEGPQ
jgi:PAS domain S-box-containing protein